MTSLIERNDEVDEGVLDGDHDIDHNGNEPEDEVIEESAPGKRRPNFLVIGLVASVLGLSLLLFVVYVYVFSNFKEERAQHQLLNVFTTPAGAVPLSGQLPPDGAPAAVLKIPSIHLKQVVVQGSSASQTALGPGLMSQSARPGTIGNAVILGHRTTSGAPFRNLDQLKLGEHFTLVSGLGSFHYVIVERGFVRVGQRDPASPVDRAQVTLMTSSTQAGTSGSFYVVGRQLNTPGAAKKPKVPPANYQRGLSGDPAAIPASIVLGILYALGIIATIVSYRRFRHSVWTVYILSTPILLALAFWWFENLYLLLPATL